MTTTQTITLDGVCYRPLLLTAFFTCDGQTAWKVIHGPSGMLLHRDAAYADPMSAEAAMSRLLALDVPWGDPDPRAGALRAALEHNHRLILAAIKGE